MAYKPNKWGYEGWNCKWKPSGSGRTTHANRRAQRKLPQWEELEVKEPDTEEAVEDHVKALEKAAKKARERLEELKAKSLEKDQKTIGTGYGRIEKRQVLAEVIQQIQIL